MLLLFLLLLLLLHLLTVSAIPPAPPIHCNTTTQCTVSNAYGVFNTRAQCTVPTVSYPTTEPELVSIVASASLNNHNIKVVSAFSHTIPNLICPYPSSGGTTVISTKNYVNNIVVSVSKMTVTVDSGVGMREVVEAVEKEGLNLAAAPYWEGVSVGGVLATGAHGSSWWGKGGAVHDWVVGVRVVVPAGAKDGYAKVLSLDSASPDFNAVRVSLGLLGVVSQVVVLNFYI